jgi:ribosome-binding ATPase YchF (GTP1/OBG family)
VIQTELCLADLASVEKSLQRHTKAAKSGNDKEAQKLVDVLTKCVKALDQVRPVRSVDFCREEQALLKPFGLITAKPAMFVANVDEGGFEGNPHLDRLRAYAAPLHAPVVPICAKTEAELAGMDAADRLMFLEEMGQTEPGLNRLIRAAFSLLGAPDLLHGRAQRGARLDDSRRRYRAAGRRRDPYRLRARLHPRPDDRLRRLHRVRGEHGAKEAGKMRAEGKEYIVKDGDVLNFLFNV